MNLIWSDSSLADLRRLYRFLERSNRAAAARAVADIRLGARKLLTHPRLGPRADIEGGEVRYLFVSDYEIRYELRGDDIYVLRVWHMRESR